MYPWTITVGYHSWRGTSRELIRWQSRGAEKESRPSGNMRWEICTFYARNLHSRVRSRVLEPGAVREGEGRMGVATRIFSTRAIAVPKTRPQRVRFAHPVRGWTLFLVVQRRSRTCWCSSAVLSLSERTDSARLGTFATRVGLSSVRIWPGERPTVINNKSRRTEMSFDTCDKFDRCKIEGLAVAREAENSKSNAWVV